MTRNIKKWMLRRSRLFRHQRRHHRREVTGNRLFIQEWNRQNPPQRAGYLLRDRVYFSAYEDLYGGVRVTTESPSNDGKIKSYLSILYPKAFLLNQEYRTTIVKDLISSFVSYWSGEKECAQ